MADRINIQPQGTEPLQVRFRVIPEDMEEGAQSAIYALRSHQTLQGIQAKISAPTWDDDQMVTLALATLEEAQFLRDKWPS